MKIIDEQGFLSWDAFHVLEQTIQDLLKNLQKEKNDPNVVKLEVRWEQTKEIYNALKEMYFMDATLLMYSRILIDLTMSTTRLTDPAWALMEKDKKGCKHLITEVYNLQDIFKESLALKA